MKSTYIVIAGYNEENRISAVINDLKKAGYKNIIVVDDCSKDNTSAVAKKAGATVLRHILNRGQGAALKTGIEYALSKNADYIVTFDADGQHRVEDLPAMLAPVTSGKVDITVGSRFLKKTQVPFARKILLKGSVIIIWLFYGIRMTDAHNGFRVISREAAKKIEITQDRMAHASEIIGEIKRKHLRYAEVPVVIKYSEETLRKGHGNIFQAFKVLWNMVMEKMMR